ncbi:MAG: WD40 repeat domain-containing protein [Cytophagales bacterium]|nr:WD40 repeat domain-containing protein [Cytophagales bacterium]MDW8384493.1 WD40 repeat domain-containing protein [Flammeovirgaceae bacterium]
MIKTPSVQKIASFTGHRDAIYALSYGGNHFFYTAGSDGMVVRWNVLEPEKGFLVAKVPNTVYALHCDISRKWLIIGQNFDGVHLISLETGKEIGSIHLENAPFFEILTVKNFVLVASGSGKLFVIDLKTGSIAGKIPLSDASLRTIAYNAVDDEIAIGGSDHKIRILDPKFSIKQEIEAHTNSVFSLCYSPHDQTLWSGSRDAHLKAWKKDSQTYVLLYDIVAHMFTINYIAFSPSGKHFATCSKDKSIKLWNSQSGKLLKVIDKSRHAGHGTSVNKLCWLNESQLISCSDDKTASLWQITWVEESQ